MGFYGVSTKSLMDQLIERYGKIQVLDIVVFRQDLAEPIEVDRPIDTYFQHVDDAI